MGGAEEEEVEEGVAGDDLVLRLMVAMSQEKSLRSAQRWVSSKCKRIDIMTMLHSQEQ